MRLILFSKILASLALVSAGEDRIGFVYELVRHGARATMLSGE
jgi:hypothetical protein